MREIGLPLWRHCLRRAMRRRCRTHRHRQTRGRHRRRSIAALRPAVIIVAIVEGHHRRCQDLVVVIAGPAEGVESGQCAYPHAAGIGEPQL